MLPMPKLPKVTEPFQRIAFYGPMVSGKTYLANHLVANHNYRKVAFADKLKSLAYELFGVQYKDGPDRIILQKLGDAMRSIDEDVWIKYALNTIQMNKYLPNLSKYRVVIDDLRLANEAKWLKKNGFILIYVDADENIRVERMSTLYPNAAPEALLHASEQEYKHIVPDYILKNNSPLSLDDLDYGILGSKDE